LIFSAPRDGSPLNALMAFEAAARPVCVNWARMDLCGGRLATVVPNANAWMTTLSMRADGRRPRCTRARNRGWWGADDAGLYGDLAAAGMVWGNRFGPRRRAGVRWGAIERAEPASRRCLAVAMSQRRGAAWRAGSSPADERRAREASLRASNAGNHHDVWILIGVGR
jgi:hypothetical protein